jgi:hypothetical protein
MDAVVDGSGGGGATGLKRIGGVGVGTVAAGTGGAGGAAVGGETIGGVTRGGVAGADADLTGSPVRSGSQPSRSLLANPDEPVANSPAGAAFAERAAGALPCASDAASTLANAASRRSK